MLFGIDHVQLAAPPGCEEAARAFYSGVLGLVELTKPAALQSRGGCWFQCGTHQIHIGVEADFSAARKAHPAFAVHDIDALRDRLQAAHVAVQNDDSIPGTSRFYIHDPWGNRLEFLERNS